MENKDIVEALEKAPELVKAAETFKATSGHIVSSLADAVKQRPQAEIPESELQKISGTPCAPPDVDSFSKALVQKVAGDIGSTIKEKVDKALEGATVKVQHTHTHSYCIEKDLKEYADIRLWNRSIAFGLTSVVLAAIIAIIAIVYYNSETYWGKQFYQVYSSPYLTEEEWENISQDIHTIAILPNEFDKDPKRVKERIKKNKDILKERKKENPRH
ncbi:MAG: hypothetical protein J6N46_06235 [Bacteroidales bacterium]|nr:hypothetical protein [Bacteroidales bacterium]